MSLCILSAVDIFSQYNMDHIVQAGADVNLQNNMGDTPLHKAAYTGRKVKHYLSAHIYIYIYIEIRAFDGQCIFLTEWESLS